MNCEVCGNQMAEVPGSKRNICAACRDKGATYSGTDTEGERLNKVSEGLKATFELFSKDYSKVMKTDVTANPEKQLAAAGLAQALATLTQSQILLELVRVLRAR